MVDEIDGGIDGGLEGLLAVLNIQNQKDIARVMDRDSLELSNILAYEFPRPELDDSAIRLVEFLHKTLELSFAGVYIDSGLDTGAQVDRRSRLVMPAHWENAPQDVASVNRPDIMSLEGYMRIVHPLKHGDQDSFGVAVFEKPRFSVQDIALLKDAVRKFSSHTNNIHEKYALRKQVITDDLTGLYNKRKLRRDYLDAVRNWNNQGHHFGLIFGDVDNFKQINTFYGHAYADDVLETIGRLLRESLDPHLLLYKFGGEEFVVLCPGASPEDTERYARRICDVVRSYTFPDGDDGRPAREITMCMGTVSTMEEDLADRRILNVAIKRMLKAKGYESRDRVVSNVRFDIDTGLASMPLFIPHLNQRIKQCNAGRAEGKYGNIAVLNFDIVHFSKWLNDPANEPAWDVFKTIADWWKGEIGSFSYVARANNRDNIVAYVFSESPGDGFEAQVWDKAGEYLKKLRALPINFKGRQVHFDYAVGGVIYDPSRIDYVPKARFLTRAAENMVDIAGELPERIMIAYFQDPASSQPSPDPVVQLPDHQLL
ncbi:GGDEF domain-containing protein [Candidatus Woesearchaeota archaeon]|nr:GGDEF domain-containing protein [Candidatus Woesearchaeota archaeon]